jgi:hypothetical protein
MLVTPVLRVEEYRCQGSVGRMAFAAPQEIEGQLPATLSQEWAGPLAAAIDEARSMKSI